MSNKEPAAQVRRFNSWVAAAIIMIAVIIGGSIFIGWKLKQERGVEITFNSEEISISRVYVSGEVNNPGFYPLRERDDIRNILDAAGGLTDNADSGSLGLTVYGKESIQTPQKIDINRAEVWLLAALPGIGETRASAIVTYRNNNGLFRDIHEIMKVPGIGQTTFDAIKMLIVVAE